MFRASMKQKLMQFDDSKEKHTSSGMLSNFYLCKYFSGFYDKQSPFVEFYKTNVYDVREIAFAD